MKFEITVGKVYEVSLENDEFICRHGNEEHRISRSTLLSFSMLSEAASLDLVLSALNSVWYVAARQPLNKKPPIPVYGAMTKEDCLAWMENQIGDWILIHNAA